jgi:hypothetical protein
MLIEDGPWCLLTTIDYSYMINYSREVASTPDTQSTSLDDKTVRLPCSDALVPY